MMFPTKVIEKIKTLISCVIFFSPEIVTFMRKYGGKKYGRARQDTDDNIKQRMRFACWINETRIQPHTQNI